MHYYPVLSEDRDTAHRPWTSYDDQLVSLLFNKIVNRTALARSGEQQAQNAIAASLFDLCFYINKDVHHC